MFHQGEGLRTRLGIRNSGTSQSRRDSIRAGGLTLIGFSIAGFWEIFDMPRRREVPKRETLPDPLFGSTLITKFINCMMIQGKKSVAEGAFYGSLDLVKDRAKEDPVKIFKKALENVKPILEVKSRRVGGATYQVPIEVSQERRTSLAIRWVISNARARGERPCARGLQPRFSMLQITAVAR